MRRYIPKFTAISFILLIASLIVYRLCIFSPLLSDFVNGTASVAVRYLLSSLTCFVPFSIFEILIILSPFIVIFAVASALRSGATATLRVRRVMAILGVVSLIFISYIYTLGIGYYTTSLSEKTGIEDKRDISAEELYYTADILVKRINEHAEELSLVDGETVMPYSVDEMSEKLVLAYDKLNDHYSLLTNYRSRVKPVYFSTVMSDLRISGIYSFFTGEANVNVEYPDYCLPNTAAHELAHQRGISRENEANFVAFLVCINSDDPYIRYSGYLSLYEYVASALYRADIELYQEIRACLSPVAIADMRAANAVYKEHEDSVLGRINEKLNDAYLKANGTEGIVTYGYVTRLAVGYYQSEK